MDTAPYSLNKTNPHSIKDGQRPLLRQAGMLEDSMEGPLPGSLEGKEGNRVTWLSFAGVLPAHLGPRAGAQHAATTDRPAGSSCRPLACR